VRVVVDGRKVQRSAATVKEAKTLRDELRVARARGTFKRAEPSTLAQYAEAWLAGYHGRTGSGIRAGTVEGYRRDLELHVLPAFGGRPIGAITPQLVKALARALAEGTAPAGRGGPGGRSHQRRCATPWRP
jgi:hypothetical protein